MSDKGWNAIFEFYDIHDHDFTQSPFYITATQIKHATKQFTATRDREPRLLCKHDTREARPQVFKDKNLFLLPVKNGEYAILQGEGYVDIPPITSDPEKYVSILDFELKTANVGNSEMQHVDYAYAASLIRSVMDDDSLVLTIRGRKYTPAFEFKVGSTTLKTKSVQTNVNTIYEGINEIILVKTIFPFTDHISAFSLFSAYQLLLNITEKPIKLILLEKIGRCFGLWQMIFDERNNLSSCRIEPLSRWSLKTD